MSSSTPLIIPLCPSTTTIDKKRKRKKLSRTKGNPEKKVKRESVVVETSTRAVTALEYLQSAHHCRKNKNYKEAFNLYRLAAANAKNGSRQRGEAEAWIVHLLLSPTLFSIPSDPSFDLLTLAKQGVDFYKNPLAYYNLASIYYYNLCEVKGEDWKEQVMTLLNTGSTLNDMECQYLLGALYFEGEQTYGIKKDYKTALHFFNLGATQGDGLAEFKIGEIYQEGGQGVKLDIKEACRHFHLAAKLGVQDGIYELAALYRDGSRCGAVRKDMNEARYYKRRSRCTK